MCDNRKSRLRSKDNVTQQVSQYNLGSYTEKEVLRFKKSEYLRLF